jgi:hypothetical protein
MHGSVAGTSSVAITNTDMSAQQALTGSDGIRMESATKHNVFAYFAIGLFAYLAGAGALFVGLQTGGRIFGAEDPQAWDAMNYFWVAILTGCAFPGLGTALAFYFLNWLLGWLLRNRQITDVSSHVAGVAFALLLSLGLTFGLGIYLVYHYLHSL